MFRPAGVLPRGEGKGQTKTAELVPMQGALPRTPPERREIQKRHAEEVPERRFPMKRLPPADRATPSPDSASRLRRMGGAKASPPDEGRRRRTWRSLDAPEPPVGLLTAGSRTAGLDAARVIQASHPYGIPGTNGTSGTPHGAGGPGLCAASSAYRQKNEKKWRKPRFSSCQRRALPIQVSSLCRGSSVGRAGD